MTRMLALAIGILLTHLKPGGKMRFFPLKNATSVR
jgi:hypothetical protein